MDEKLRLDGNAAAGALAEVFSFEVTTAEYACVGCGVPGPLGAATVYEVRGMGTVIRCPGCDHVLIRFTRSTERDLVDLTGMSHLTTG